MLARRINQTNLVGRPIRGSWLLSKPRKCGRLVLSVMAMAKPAVLVYSGEGAGYRSALHALQAVQQYMPQQCEARFVTAEEVLEGSWARDCILFVMPGGADLPYCRNLNGLGNFRIQEYVRNGGAYLGICAGAYYACTRVEFEPGSTIEVIGDRELSFFPGTARGAAYAGFDYTSERGAVSAPLVFRLSGGAAAEQVNEQPQGPAPEAAAPDADGGTDLAPPSTSLGQWLDSDGLQRAVAEAHNQIGDEPHPDTGAGVAAGDCSSNQGEGLAQAAATRLLLPQPPEGWAVCLDYCNGGPMFVADGGNRSGGADHAGADGSGSSSSSSDASRNSGSTSCCNGADGPAYEVLAMYGDLDDGAVAAVRCPVGYGVAVLCGTHPELPHSALSVVTLESDPEQAAHVTRLAGRLARFEAQRRAFWAMLLLACCRRGSAAAAVQQQQQQQGGAAQLFAAGLRERAAAPQSDDNVVLAGAAREQLVS